MKPKDEPRSSASPGSGTRLMQAIGRIPVWQKLLLLVAVGLMATGVTLGVLAPAQGAETIAAPGSSAEAQGFMPGTGEPLPTAGDASSEPMEDAWSPAIFRLGFSFFVGFAVAFALRAFVRLTVFTMGFFFLALFGLQYAGFIEVNWTAIGDRYESTSAWFLAQFESVQELVTGYLPAAGSAAAGLTLGFLRK